MIHDDLSHPVTLTHVDPLKMEPIDSINSSLSQLCPDDDDEAQFHSDNLKRFCSYCKRLQAVLQAVFTSFRTSLKDNPPANVDTGLRGIAADLAKAVEIVAAFRSKSRIFLLIKCELLCSQMQEVATGIGGWLALLQSEKDPPLLRKKIVDLCADLKQARFPVAEVEDRVMRTLMKEGEGRPSNKAVCSAIVMDLSRALGVEPSDYSELSKQVNLLKLDSAHLSSVYERRMLQSLERIMESWNVTPSVLSLNVGVGFEDDAHILPFKNFLCPLTKEVMKEPVVLETSQTYEKTAIEYWFKRCEEDLRDPTCPVTGRVVKSLELKPNIGLAGVIEEWVNRNIELQVKSVVQVLSEEATPAPEALERAVESVCFISEEHPSSRYKVRNAGIVHLIVTTLESKQMDSCSRGKCLKALLSLARDEESKIMMLESGVTRFAIHGLMGSSEKEKEYAMKLLLTFSTDDACCVKIANEKGALVLLSSIEGNSGDPALSNLAEEVLIQMEKLEENIQPLTAAGRFEALITRLRKGSQETKTKMATILGAMTLTNSNKEYVARRCTKSLVGLLSKPDVRTPALQALHNLSSLDDNATVLVRSGVLPYLTDVLLKDLDASAELREVAASTIANIVSNPGHWELAPVDKSGNTMQSEAVVSDLLELLRLGSSSYHADVLRILCGMASSPQASESVTTHIKSGDGMNILLPFLEDLEAENRIFAFRLAKLLSERFSHALAAELKSTHRLLLLKQKVLDSGSTCDERSDAACILANLPLSADDVSKTLGGAGFMKWAVDALRDQRGSRSLSSMSEGILGLLLLLTRSLNQETLAMVRETRLMDVLCDQLGSLEPNVNRLAAVGLTNLSELGWTLVASSEPKPPQRSCLPLAFMCGVSSMNPDSDSCPIHNTRCTEDAQLCLLKNNCVKPLVHLLSDTVTSVQLAAVDALSTLLVETSTNFKLAVDLLDSLGAVHALISLFTEVRPGNLQERLMYVVDRILKSESLSHQYALDQTLLRALVEAFKHGNASTKKHAQSALTNLKQISGVSSSRPVSQARRR
uniref:RING-type E3 ubiquitin transferase n=1 Tax=Kalanchoe fedtschenkoi TaxID=63787 RepID=A0A7N0U4A5_KALFE